MIDFSAGRRTHPPSDGGEIDLRGEPDALSPIMMTTMAAAARRPAAALAPAPIRAAPPSRHRDRGGLLLSQFLTLYTTQVTTSYLSKFVEFSVRRRKWERCVAQAISAKRRDFTRRNESGVWASWDRGVPPPRTALPSPALSPSEEVGRGREARRPRSQARRLPRLPCRLFDGMGEETAMSMLISLPSRRCSPQTLRLQQPRRPLRITRTGRSRSSHHSARAPPATCVSRQLAQFLPELLKESVVVEIAPAAASGHRRRRVAK